MYYVSLLRGELVYLDQLARHGAHVGAAMTLYLSHVSHAANAEPEVLEGTHHQYITSVNSVNE